MSGLSRVLAGILLVLAPTPGFAETTRTSAEWKFEAKDERAGWRLYTRPVPGSDYPRYRLVARSDEPIERVIAALQRKSHDDRYLPKGHERRVLERGDDFYVAHVRIDAPIIADRDTVLRLGWQTEHDTGVHRVEWGQPDGELPPVADDAVRIVSEGAWTITPLSQGGTELVYESHSELGRSVPGWLVDRLMDDQIVNEFLTVQRILEDDLLDVAVPPPARD